VAQQALAVYQNFSILILKQLKNFLQQFF